MVESGQAAGIMEGAKLGAIGGIGLGMLRVAAAPPPKGETIAIHLAGAALGGTIAGSIAGYFLGGALAEKRAKNVAAAVPGAAAPLAPSAPLTEEEAWMSMAPTGDEEVIGLFQGNGKVSDWYSAPGY